MDHLTPLVLRAIVFLLYFLSQAAVAQGKDPAIDCLMKLKDDARFSLLFAKMPMDITKGQPIELMADGSKINAKEKAQLSIFVKEGQACYDSGADWRQQNYPVQMNSIMIAYVADGVSVMADLYSGKMTVGEVAKYRAKRLAEFQVAINTAVQDIKAKQEAKLEAEEAQRKIVQNQERLQQERMQQERQLAEERQRQEQELAYQQQQQQESRRQAALKFIFRPQPAFQLPIPPQPRFTNCLTSGNMTNCTTN